MVNMRGCSTKSKVFSILTIISVVLVIVSIVLIVEVIPVIIDNEVDKNVRLENGTEQFDRFIELPFPIKFKVYIFNITNVDKVLNGAIPTLKEIGPYVYDQYRKKTIESYDNEEDTISYRERETFIFNPKESGDLTQSDRIFIYNAPLMIALQLGEPIAGLFSECIKKTFPGGKTDVLMETSVREYLFDGVKFCLEDQIQFGCKAACALAKNLKNVDADKNGLRFSLFNYKRIRDDGLYTVKRGMRDIETLGHILTLDHSMYTKYWNSKEETRCDHVKGTDSTLYAPRVTKNDVFQIYATDICRYVDIYYQGEGSYKDIDGYEFAVTKNTLRPMTEHKEADCFCTNRTAGIYGQPTCYLDGVIDLEPCVGVPVLLSFPHFLWADDAYIKPFKTETFSPNESLHRTFLLVEPNTGTPLQGVKRIQMNVVLRNISSIEYTDKLPRIVLPLAWLEEGVSLTDEYVDKLKSLYFDKIKIAGIAQWTLLGVSSAASIIFGGLFMYYFWQR